MKMNNYTQRELKRQRELRRYLRAQDRFEKEIFPQGQTFSRSISLEWYENMKKIDASRQYAKWRLNHGLYLWREMWLVEAIKSVQHKVRVFMTRWRRYMRGREN